jgi:hypothetical protein
VLRRFLDEVKRLLRANRRDTGVEEFNNVVTARVELFQKLGIEIERISG